MKNQNITFQQFIEKLKTIDVGELLDKAKSIKVEDIKSIKLSDLKEITNQNFLPIFGNNLRITKFNFIFIPFNRIIKK